MIPPSDSPRNSERDNPEPFNPWDPDRPPPQARRKLEGLETPLNVRQVGTHLIFGFFARHVPLIPVVGGLVILFLIGLTVMQLRDPQNPPRIVPLFLAGGGLAVLGKASLRQQAIIGWIATKLGLAVLCLIVAPAALGLWLRDHRHDQQQLFFLALIWMPGLEFIPKVTPHQRYLTLARLLLSIPCVLKLIQLSG